MEKLIQPLSDNITPESPTDELTHNPDAIVGDSSGEQVTQPQQAIATPVIQTASAQPYVQNQVQSPSTQSSDGIPIGMSASQLGLDYPSKGVDWKKFVKAGVFILVLLVILAGGWFFVEKATSKTSSLKPYTVSQSNPPFSVNFYPGALVEQKNNLTYLISKDPQGKQTGVWVASISSPLSCASSPSFTFTSSSGSQETGCYRSDRIIYTAGVKINSRLYQINMTSQKPVSGKDAQAIFSSLTIQ